MITTEEKNSKVFSTRDIYLASTLITLKFPLISTDLQYEGIKNRPIGYFQFDDTASLRDARSKYNQGLIMVEPRMFMNNLQALKSDVTSMAQNPHNFS